MITKEPAIRFWTIAGVGLALMLALGAVYWLFYDNRLPSSGRFQLDIRKIRAQAESIPGAKAKKIEVEILSHERVPEIAMVAGTSWKKIDLVRVSYRVVFTDQSIIIDTAYDAETARDSGADSYDATAWQRMQNAMKEASQIVVTHEHPDHIGGLLTSPYWAQILPKARITVEQFNDAQRTLPVVWPRGSRKDFKPIQYSQLLAIAPGVVLIRAPGHTPGSQMIYVQSTTGREYIFMGDVASCADNVRLLRIRSRLVTDFMDHEDRRAEFLQTEALHALAVAEPGVVLVPGHDAAAIDKFVGQGLLVPGFTP